MTKSLKEEFEERYEHLAPEDFELPVTPEKRIRVAAAVATVIRDTNLFGGGPGPGPNAETIRAILTMGEDEWALDVPSLANVLKTFDPVSARDRFDQMKSRQAPRGRIGN